MLMFVYHFLAINRLITICQVGRFLSLLFAFSKHNDRLSDGGWRSSGSSLNNTEEANCVLLTKGKITTTATTIRSFSKVQPEVGMRPNCRREGMWPKKPWNLHHLYKPGKSIRPDMLINILHAPFVSLLLFCFSWRSSTKKEECIYIGFLSLCKADSSVSFPLLSTSNPQHW